MRGGRAEPARRVAAAIDEILNRPEHQWLQKGAEEQADAINREMQRRYGQTRQETMTTRIGRRTFLKMAGVAAPAVAASRAPIAGGGASRQRGARRPRSVTWDKAPCRFCGTGCGVMVGVEQGRVVAVRGDEASPVNRGLLCVKGYHLPGLLYGDDRLLYPQKRNADGSFARISWDEALDLVATRFGDALKQHGPDAVGMYGSGQWTVFDGYAAQKWVKGGLRSNNLEPNARLCMASAVSGFLTQFQSDEPMGCYQDLDLARRLRALGQQHGRDAPGALQPDPRNQAPEAGDADRRHRHPAHADHRLRRPARAVQARAPIWRWPTASCICSWPRGRIQRRSSTRTSCSGAASKTSRRSVTAATTSRPSDIPSRIRRGRARSTSCAPSSPTTRRGECSEITSVPVEQIRALASIYGDLSRGTVSLWCMGVNQHVRGTWMNNLITDLHLITGKICRPGSNPLSLTGQPSACGTAREVGTSNNRLPADMVVTNPEHRAEAEHIWKLPPGTIPATPGYHAVDMFRAVKRGDLKALWIQTTNPWVTLPNRSRFDRSPGDGRFIVVSDIYPTPTTAIADLILPAAAWVEREGIFGNTERRTQHWKKMIDPPGEAREDAWQVMQVAKRMGMGHLFPWPEDNWHEPMFEEYRSFGLGHGKDLASYAQLNATRGMLWPVVNGKETPYRYTAGYDPYVKKSRGAHFYKAVGTARRRRSGCGRTIRRPRRPTRLSLLAHDRPCARALAHAAR